MDAMQKMLEMYKQQLVRQFDECSVPVVCAIGQSGETTVTMDDGVKLRTMYWKPEGKERFPVILLRSCYPNQEPVLVVKAEQVCRRGFGVVLQWCRGTGGSEGEWEPNIYDRADGLATMRWLDQMDEVESIGYWGDSYLAYTGWCMADAVPDKCKTMYLGVYGCDRHVSAYQDGLFRQDILTGWAMGNAGRPIDADYIASCRYRPQVEVDEAMWGIKLDWYRDWITNTDRDSEYWSQGLWRKLRETPSEMKIPVFIRDGWYDHHLGSAIATYRSLSPESRAHTTLQLGPWNHSYGCALTGQDTANLKDDSIESPMAWFKRILLDGENPPPEVQTYVCGKDEWECWNQFPVPVSEYRTLYLDAAGAKKEDAYRLGDTLAENNAQVSYRYDPDDPVLSFGAESLFVSQGGVGSLRQPPCSWRKDILSFLSPVFTEDTELGGSIKVRLYVSSDAPDTAFAAKVMEVLPNGTTYNIRGSITTLAYRGHSEHRQSYTPGQIVEVEIDTWEISWMLKAGSRLRVDITSSDFPQYSIHPNKEGPWSVHKDVVPAIQTVYTGKDYPSAVILPVVYPQK